LALAHPVHLRTLAKGAVIRIGARSGLSGTCVCALRSVSIGTDCLIGANVLIVDTDFHPLRAERRRTAPPSSAATAPVTIGNNVFIGAHSIILKGVTIGDDAVIGAGSVVSRDVPVGVIFAGNPARLVRPLGAGS
jgi:acetyltransferase-like isoleucine patch superfamily enzyme